METTNNTLKDFQLSGSISKKSDQQYGKQIIDSVDRYVNSSYFMERNKRFSLNERMAAGRMDMEVFKTLFDMADTQKNYSKMIWKSIMIVNTIIARMVGRWMQTKEKAVVKAVDEISVNKKQIERDTAEFYLDNKDILAEVEKASGVPMIPPDQFIPDDRDHLDIWTKYELYLPEEYLYRKGINTVLDDNGWGFTGVNRRRLKHNSATFGFVGTYTWADSKGKIHVDWVNPKNAIYSVSEYDDFRDTAYRGHIVSKKLSEIRDEFPGLSEKDLFDQVVPNAVEWQNNDKIAWTQDWIYSYSRPYDEWNVDIVFFELRTLDHDTYNMKVTSNGNLLIEKGVKTDLNGNISTETKTKWNIYQGIYVKKNRFKLKWALKENPVTPQDPKYSSEAEFSYSFYMYHNVSMRNLAVPEKIEEPVEGMILARLKIQLMVADMVQSGYAVDVDGLQSIDLGTGDGALSPIQLKRVYKQTGDQHYRGKDAEGNRQPIPITELPNTGSVAQLTALITIYNFHLSVLRDEIGENEITEGQTPKPRTTNEAVQTSMEISFNAVDYMQDACLSVMKETSKKIACLLHDSVEFGGSEYRSIIGEEDVKDRVYDVSVEMQPDEEQINQLMYDVNNFIAQSPDFILYINPIKIRKIAEDDLDLAALYFRRAQKKAIQGQQKQAQLQAQMNADAQTQSAMQKAQAEAENQKEKYGFEMSLAKERQREITLTGLFSIYSKGLPIPESLKAVEGEVVHNVLLPIFAENVAMQQQAAQQPAPEMQGQEEEQQEQPPMQ